VRLGPEHRASVRGKPGIWCRPQKTRRRRKTGFIPLAAADALELDRWAHEPMAMTWGRWLATKEGKALCAKWRAWLEEMKRRYEWEVDPEDVRGPTIHGLRGTGILARFAAGYDVGQIANDIGASRQTVEHYMRFRDQMEVAAVGGQRLRLIEKG
jgi:hypothetical protein